MKKEWFVYILRCNDDTLYTGITPDLETRLALHNAGKGAKYTRGRGPVIPIYQEKCESYSQALRREHEIKQMPRRQKLLLCGLSQEK